MSPGRSRKPLWIFGGAEDVGCWSVVVTGTDSDCGECNSPLPAWRCCEFSSLGHGLAERRGFFYKRETNERQLRLQIAWGLGFRGRRGEFIV
jgi:hypothetical protein